MARLVRHLLHKPIYLGLHCQEPHVNASHTSVGYPTAEGIETGRSLELAGQSV